jgi:hypothetical protein
MTNTTLNGLGAKRVGGAATISGRDSTASLSLKRSSMPWANSFL